MRDLRVRQRVGEGALSTFPDEGRFLHIFEESRPYTRIEKLPVQVVADSFSIVFTNAGYENLKSLFLLPEYFHICFYRAGALYSVLNHHSSPFRDTSVISKVRPLHGLHEVSICFIFGTSSRLPNRLQVVVICLAVGSSQGRPASGARIGAPG